MPANIRIQLTALRAAADTERWRQPLFALSTSVNDERMILMPAYVIALYNVWDSSWRATYREPVIELIEKHGGRYLVRADVCPWEMLEGEKPDINGLTLIEFPSMEHARAWHRDVDYQPYIKLRQAGAKVNMMLADGWDGTFPSPKN